MSILRHLFHGLLGAAFAIGVFAPSPSVAAATNAPPGALPGDSIYQLDLTLTNQDAQDSRLADLAGRPVLITMFYTSCKFVCPLTIQNLQRMERALTPAERAQLRIVLVSIDPERDTPQVLKTTAAERHVDLSRWMLARTDADGVRKLAAVLGVQYRELAGGDFNHSTIVTLLDREGRAVARTERINEVDPELLKATQAELANKS